MHFHIVACCPGYCLSCRYFYCAADCVAHSLAALALAPSFSSALCCLFVQTDSTLSSITCWTDADVEDNFHSLKPTCTNKVLHLSLQYVCLRALPWPMCRAACQSSWPLPRAFATSSTSSASSISSASMGSCPLPIGVGGVPLASGLCVGELTGMDVATLGCSLAWIALMTNLIAACS